MRLKKISIIGFKSFADKTVLNFDAGITCIVGPNGCGKSNIADAFRWVLGEQSAKSLRGAKMPDVIFAGTTHRKPLNYAEVSLTLTEVQGALPIEYDEVTFTRRLHRSGESEYFLNQNPVRLKDLQALFLGSGVGRHAFSIFEQGKLDQVISYSPQERRYIFEEAAGIVRFLQRKKEALKRLEQTDLNLSHGQDIHREVEQQIKTLETQAKQARLFKENQTQLEQLEKMSYWLRWQAIEKKKNDLEKKLAHTQTQLTQSQEIDAQFQQTVNQLKQQVQQQDLLIRAQSEKTITLKGQQELLLHDCQSQKKRADEALQRNKRLKRELEELELARLTHQKTLKEIHLKRQQLDSEWNEVESHWSVQQKQVKQYEDEVVQLRQQVTRQQQTYVKLIQQESEGQSQLKQLDLQLMHLNERQQTNQVRLQQLSQDSNQLTATIQEKKKQLKNASGVVDHHKDRLIAYEEDLKKMAQEQEAAQGLVDQQRRQLIEMQARQKVLLKMREEHEGFSSGSQRLLQETQNIKSPLYQTLRPLYEYLQPEPQWAEVLAAVLRFYAQTLVVESQKDFEKILAFVAHHQIQDFSLICVEWIARSLKPLTADWQGKVNPHLLAQHFLQDVTIVKSLKNYVPQQLMEDGSFIDYRGVWFKTKANENQLFLRESELNTLAENLAIKEEETKKIEERLIHIKQKRLQAQSERGELDQVLRRDEMKLIEINFGLQQIIVDTEKNRLEQQKCQQEIENSQIQLIQQKENYTAFEQRYRQLKNELIQVQQAKEVLQQELLQQEAHLQLQQQDQQAKRENYQQLTDNRQQLKHQAQLIESKQQDYEKQVQRLADELAEIAEQQLDIRQQEQISKQKLAQLETELQQVMQVLLEQEKQGELFKNEWEKAEQKWKLASESLKKLEHDHTQLSMQLQHQQTLAQTVIAELDERYHLTMQEAESFSPEAPKSLEHVEKQIRLLRQTLQETGHVNLTAIEELEKHQVRYTFLKQQMDDVGASKEELLAMIQQLDEESRHLFKETFELIRANFRKNFAILFNGGEADLQLTAETTDILEAGIEIIAKPPGKQMRSISLLSGGEKCLTAVALLFALFEVKPAPFCILDEIDAPLDDTNVERFLNVVKHFVDRCQFLIITHNKRTMAIGDVLFGVSMEEKGVSKLLSLQFSHQELPEASLV